MPTADDYVTPEARYAEQAHEMSGAPPSPGMAPYPLYGLPTLGQEETAQPFYRKPWFCCLVGGVAGFGAGYAVFGFLMPRMKPNPKRRRRRTTRRKKAEEETEES